MDKRITLLDWQKAGMTAEDLYEPVLFDEIPAPQGFKIGVAKLNSAKSLNALSLDMIRLLERRLRAWVVDPAIAVVVLHGAGEKAFCAGGDIRKLRQALVECPSTPHPLAITYFTEEYALDYLIHTYEKPILLWGNGIVMGGGLGLMAGASHRVVTENVRIAMPEISIGLYPDVGGSWFLNRAPAGAGLFLALTGAEVNADDAFVLNLGDFFIEHRLKADVFDRLAHTVWSAVAEENHGRLSRLLREFVAQTQVEKPVSLLCQHFAQIHAVTDGDTLLDVVQQIKALASHDEPWLRKAAQTLAAGSPSSAALSWAIAHRARHMSLAEAFRMELVLSVQCCARPDFSEGVRALLVDKDNRPMWSPARLEDVTPEWVESYFQSFWTIDDHPLAALGTEQLRY